MTRRALRSLTLALLFLCAGVGQAQGLQLGFNNEDLLRVPAPSGAGVDAAGLATGLQNARGAGASVWRLQVKWQDVAPVRPPNDAAAIDPAWTGYDFTDFDRQVRAVAGAGFRPLVWFNRAPVWAEGPDRPPVTAFSPSGSWRPDAPAAGLFAQALAARYRGDFPDPLNPGASLPRVADYQAWNEPNLYVEITPQYVRQGGRWRPEAPRIFRSLVNEIYTGIKRADESISVGTGALAPFGDYPSGGNRTPPVVFWRDLLCTDLRQRSPCPEIRFDFYAHNPYSPAAPTRAALNPEDVTVPDLGKIGTLVSRAVRAGTVLPKRAKPLWITELGWDTKPDPDGLSFTEQARNVQGAISVLASQRAAVILFWNMRDDPPLPTWDLTYQSGIFSRGATVAQDTRKPSYTAFRFPFTAYRSRSRALLWGKAPAAGQVVVQRRSGKRWITVTRLRPGRDGVFSKPVNLPGSTKLRATQGTSTSLVWVSR